jgi:hypothetical protein
MSKLQPKLQLQPFDSFIHKYSPAASHPGSEDRTIQLWVWVLGGPHGSPEAFWEPVSIGYVCPGPGLLKGRHLMITGKGEPTWVTGSTRYRRYKAVHRPSTAPFE